MSYKNFEKALDTARQCSGYLVGEGINEKTLEAAQEKLNIQFSTQLIIYLKQYGFLEIDGNEFYGIIKEDFTAIPEGSIVESAIYNREKFNLPLSWIPFYNYNDGYMAYLDYSDLNSEKEPKVIMGIYTGEKYEKTEILASDLGDFMLLIVENQL